MKAQTQAALLLLSLSASAVGAADRPAPMIVAGFDLDKAASEAVKKEGQTVEPAAPASPAAGVQVQTPDVASPPVAKAAPLPAASPGKAAPSEPGTAAADDITIVSGTTTIHIPHIAIAGSGLTGQDVVAMFALKDPKAVEARLRTLDASSIDIPEMSGDDVGEKTADSKTNDAKTTEAKTPEAKTMAHWTLRQVRLSDMKAGRAATARVASATLSIKDEKSTTSFTTSAMTFDGLALGQFAHLAASARTAEREPMVALCDRMAVSAITIADDKDGATATLAALRAESIKARPFVQRPSKPAKDDEDLAMFRDLVQSSAAESIEIDGIAFGPNAAGHLKKGSLDHIAIRGLGDGKLARFEMNGLAIDGDAGKPGHVGLATAKIEGIGGEINAPSVDRVEFTGFTMDVPDDDIGKGARINATIARAAYEAQGLVIGKLPPNAVMTIDHALFHVPPQSDGAATFYAMGYKSVDLSTRIVSRYDSAAQTLSLDPFTLTATDMGTLDLRLDLTHVSQDIVSQNDAVQKAAAAAIQVKTFDIGLRNFGLVDKLMAFKAAGDGMTVAKERQTMTASIDGGLMLLGLQDQPKARHVADALRAFVADPKSLHVGLSSQNGLGMDAMPLIDSPKALLESVDVRASAND